MRRPSLASLLLLATATSTWAGCMDTDNAMWISADEQATRGRLLQLMACPLESDKQTASQIDHVACNWFVAEGLHKLYGVDDLTDTANGHWLTANEIANYVRSHTDTWSSLGLANVQSVLQEAAKGAANGQPVIAVMTGDPHGHVAIVLPGALQTATKAAWRDASGNQLKVPNSAAFSLDKVSMAYVGCRLSAGFSDPSKVELFWRPK